MDADQAAPLTSTSDSTLQPPPRPQGFKVAPSKWETVDEDQLKAEAVTSSKWDALEASAEDGEAADSPADGESADDVDGRPLVGYADDEDEDEDREDGEAADDTMSGGGGGVVEMSEERRAKLREIEVIKS